MDAGHETGWLWVNQAVSASNGQRVLELTCNHLRLNTRSDALFGSNYLHEAVVENLKQISK